MAIRHLVQSALLLAAAAIGLVATPAPAATTGAHYQQTVSLPCNPQASTCGIDFPAVGASQQLNVSRVSCWMSAFQSTAALKRVILDLLDTNSQLQLQEFLPVNAPPTANGSERDFVLNQAVNVHVAAGDHVTVEFDFLSGTGNEASCTATGTLFTQTP
jgi:hypothetical protein